MLATIAFQPEAFESAAAFFNLLTPHGRPHAKVGPNLNLPVGDEPGYCVHVVETSGREYDAEVRDVTEVEKPDGTFYHLVVWEWPDEADRGDASLERVLDIYTDIDRVEVL